ncbi:protein transport protein Sec16A isoform 3 [Homo sapiens]|uniref:Protein transport protein sec16 n=3 Tax=Homo sapiens TaxID=9606 RepID=A0A8I5KPG1_HUMAN|nr:protein transport protein Sec16A isoform X24 [Homo sapiens]XP_047280204.1 protein transport protein Sec16A isoform X24 [Homo sapiens]XP_054220384.1 protein transport protein Sec16A isoform X24 [Homo sapiens]|eukprot:XP_011517565.1 protein transport protein Sec16A isoform X16 [Homo sapiens]
MQPPPQTVPSGMAGPPPAGNPRSVFWASSPYRRRANNNAAVAPTTCPLQPVTDPFAFSRQALQSTPLGSSSKSSPPVLQGPAPAGFSQHPGLLVPHTHARDSSQGPCEPLPGPLTQPRAHASPFSGALTPSAPPGPEMNRSAEVGPSSEPEVQTLPYLPHYIPGVDPETSHGGHPHGNMPGLDRPLSRQNPHDGVVTPAASPSLPQPGLQMPGQWGPVQGGPQPSGQHRSPCPEGPVPSGVPCATSVPHFPTPSILHQGPGHEQHSPLVAPPAALPSDGRDEVSHLQSGSHLANNSDPESTFRQNPRIVNHWASPELRQNPGVKNEHRPASALVNPLARGDSPENRTHHPLGAGAGSGCAPLEADSGASGALAMFFQGGETENEENLSSEKAGLSGQADFDDFCSSPGLGRPPAPTHVGAGSLCQALLPGPSNEAAGDVWGDTASTGVPDASGSQYENVENLEFVQNQEVLPSEPLNLDPSSPSDQFRYGPLPGPAVPRHGAVCHTGAPDATLHTVHPDSVSSSYSSRSHGRLSGSARPQELVGTFIQQEVGKPEDEASGSFFKQIDSSPVGGETDETTVSQNYRGSVSQPSTPSPPKPTGIFQTSANSSFEPVKSHLVGVKPFEADRANVVGEVRETCVRQKQCRPAAALPDASPGNLEQPPDNMETLCAPQVCPLPLNSTTEAVHMLPHAGAPPLDTVYPAPEKRPSARTQGPVKCESPATTLWAQSELPDFGGNVLLAPAAPALYVCAKPQPPVVQPPEEAMSGQQSRNPSSAAPVQSRGGIGASENLENPPKMGEEEALQSQVTKDAQGQPGLERAQQELVPPQQQASPPQLPKAMFSELSNPESLPAQGQAQNSAQSPASLVLVDAGQQLPPRPPQSSSVSLVSSGSGQAAVPSEQPWPQPVPALAPGPPPQDLAAYYYYRPLYDAYQPQYSLPYPPEPGAASLYYQDVYSLYEPRYRPYDGAASAYAQNYRYPEPERPSSRASHSSERPPPRQGYPEGYYSSKSGWSSQSDYYASYYSSQYDYGDPGHWDRYHYSARVRDPRTYDRRYWCDAEYDAYRREHSAFGDRPEKRDNNWRYDPRFTGSFDDDPDPHRDPYGEEVDRRSVHSEHSARSLHSAHSLASRRSSLSSHSHQSQIYRSHNVAAGSYEAPLPPGSFHGDFAYGTYRSNFSSGPGFPEYGYPADTVWPAMEQVSSRPTSPEKFSVPHVCARFGPGGQLIKVIPNLPSEGQPALVEVHSMEALLQHTSEQEEMRAFPGPLAKDDTHKVDVINFAQNKAMKCLQNENLIDKESASLLWNFIVLLCRQNGTVVGTDIAELLLRDHRTVWLPGKSPNEANLIDFTNEAVEQVEEEESGEAQLSFLTGGPAAAASSLERETERFRELLLYGRKKDALESAMKNGLWGHALLLASKMDSRTHARVMTRFANSLPINDPLQTVYQLMSGRMPAASTCCGDEKWGDWRPHLAMVLSNLNNNMDVESRTMATMGDTLASRGLLDAAHFCYLMAQAGFGVYTKKTTKLVLIGSNHSLPFLKFATNEAIQRTEAYEYAQSLGAETCPLPSFQVFKFIYSCRLAEMGLATQAFHYCEAIAKSILTQPHLYSPVLISQLVQMASQLRLFDPQLKEKPEEESLAAPTWLVHLQQVERQIKEGAGVWHQDGALPQQCPGTPSSEMEQLDRPGLSQPGALGIANPLLAVPAPSPEHSSPSVRLLPSAPQTLPDGPLASPARVPMFPVPLPPGPLEPGPGCVTPGPALGFLEPSGPGLPPGVPPLQERRHLLQEARSPDPGIVPQEAPVGNSLSELSEENFDGKFANLTPSRTVPDSEAPPGWDRADSGPTQPPLSLSPAPETKRPGQAAKKETKEPKKGESWFFRWLPGKKKTEAYLPDDKNKSIVWDEKKNQWVNLNEPEEEKKAPPPPPTSMPKTVQAAPPALPGPPGAPVNMYSRRAAGTRARYVDVLNPSGTQRSEPALAPADFVAPLAPLPIPSNLFVPTPDAEEPQLPDGTGREGPAAARGLANPEPAPEPKVLSSAASLPGSELPSSRPEGSQGGEAPGDLPAAGGPPSGAMPFYNPAQLAQACATSGSSRLGRIGQRKHLVLN